MATLAPTSSNMQLWECYHVTDKAVLAKLAHACLDQLTARSAQEIVVFVTRQDLYKRHAEAARKFEEGNQRRNSPEEKQDKRMTRKIVAKKFSEMIYQMMNWDNLCRYKLLGHQIEYQGEMLYVFELDEAEIFREKPKRTKQELEKMKQEMTEEELEALLKNEAKVSRTPFYPKDLDGTYGLPVDQHENHTTLQSLADYKGSGELLSQNENQDQLGET